MNCPKCKCIMLGLECDNCGYVQKKDLIDTIIEIKNIAKKLERLCYDEAYREGFKEGIKHKEA